VREKVSRVSKAAVPARSMQAMQRQKTERKKPTGRTQERGGRALYGGAVGYLYESGTLKFSVLERR
jgi:anthranilate/para-aminobenzoate synthase component I